MYRQHYLEAIEVVLTWDLSDEVLTDALNNQVMQNMNYDEYSSDALYS